MTHELEPRCGLARLVGRCAACLAALLGLIVLVPIDAQAYVGPGAGITAIGSLLALVAGLLFAVIGFVWYPIKRMRRRRREKQVEEAPKT